MFNYQNTAHNQAIYMNIHVRVYLLHAYMHSGNFARGWGQGPIFLFSRGFQVFSGEGGSNCYFIKKRVDFPGWVVRTSSPLWTCAQPIYMCLCIKPIKCSRQYFFSRYRLSQSSKNIMSPKSLFYCIRSWKYLS